MNTETGALVQLLVPALCAGAIGAGLIMFGYLSLRSKLPLYRAMFHVALCAFVFVAAEFCVIFVGSILELTATARVFHAIEQVAGAYFLATIPMFVARLIDRPTTTSKVLVTAAYVGLAVAGVVTLAAIVVPDAVISITTPDADWLTAFGDRGRGAEGPLILVRDLALAVMLLLVLATLVIEMASMLRYRDLLPTIVGLLIAAYFAADDIVHVYAGIHIGLFPNSAYQRFPLGITLFILITMGSTFRRFLDQAREIEVSNAALEWNQTELASTNHALARFVPNEFIGYLGKRSINEVAIGDHVRSEMTMMFTDIRDFTELSESMSPEENFAFVNSYLQVMGPVIRAHGGFVDKYIGDAIMALFPNRADDAVQAAIAMQLELRAFNDRRRAQDPEAPEVAVGIGIHTGEVTIGTVGDDDRMQGTVISDAVNLSSRIESLTKLYGLRVAISDRTLIELDDPGAYQLRFIGKVRVKGKTLPVSVFEIFDGDDPDTRELKRKCQVTFEQAIAAFYSADIPGADRLFREVATGLPNDRTTTIYLERIDRLRRKTERVAGTSPEESPLEEVVASLVDESEL